MDTSPVAVEMLHTKPSDKIIRVSFQITDSRSLAALEDVNPIFFFSKLYVFHIML